jgi:beta-glucuronidase
MTPTDAVGSTLAIVLALLAVFGVAALPCSAADRLIKLSGKWAFAVDPLGKGETHGWHKSESGWDRSGPQVGTGWDKVEVPHTWNVDPRYQYDGVAWYRTSFQCPPVATGQAVRLHIGAAFYKCRVWVNGKLVGSHEGGYTPFEFDISEQVEAGSWNAVSIEIDNRWDETTVPGSRPGTQPSEQLYPWWNWAGLTRDVSVTVHDQVFVERQKIETTPNVEARSASVSVVSLIRNVGKVPRIFNAGLDVRRETKPGEGAGDVAARVMQVTIPPGGTTEVKFRLDMPAGTVELWTVDSPALYVARTTLSDPVTQTSFNGRSDTFGVRSIAIRDGQLLLNGRPVRMGGANRVLDHATLGACQPPELIQQDIKLFKTAHLNLTRLQHQACDPALLDAADRQGMLIILEAANWGFKESQLSSELLRDKFRQQTRAMIELSWNNPSVIGYSVGNEYHSWTDEGRAWTKDMKAFVKTLDDTRPITFASLGRSGVLAAEALAKGVTDPSSIGLDEVDIICFNSYTSHQRLATWLDALHHYFPDKPIMVTEFGMRVDEVPSEQRRIDSFRGYMDTLRARPFVIGMSYWTFNDYRSRYPGTNPDGYRPWGVVKADRSTRPLYDVMTVEFSPATLAITKSTDGLVAKVSAKGDFPCLDLQAAKLIARDATGAAMWESDVPLVLAGESWSVTIPAELSGKCRSVELLSGTGHRYGLWKAE